MNKQQNFWKGDFGSSWARKRNSFFDAYHSWEADSKSTLKNVLTDALRTVNKDISILELGCNDGFVLKTLQDMGFTDVNGLDINEEAVKNAMKNLPDSKIYHQPLEKQVPNHDLILTSAVLIHIHPDNLPSVMKTMYMESNKYILGRELSSIEPQAPHLGDGSIWKDYYWTRRFKDMWLKMFPQLKVVYYDLIKMTSKDDIQTEVYLLEK